MDEKEAVCLGHEVLHGPTNGTTAAAAVHAADCDGHGSHLLRAVVAAGHFIKHLSCN